MKASELRLGNLVLCNTSIGFVDAIASVCNLSSDEIVCYHKPTKQFIFCKDALFEPIPLTEEWLLKLGFKNHLDTIWIHWSKESGLFEISTRLPQGSYGLWINGTMGCFEYVHQLQNLFFALTGEELTIKD